MLKNIKKSENLNFLDQCSSTFVTFWVLRSQIRTPKWCYIDSSWGVRIENGAGRPKRCNSHGVMSLPPKMQILSKNAKSCQKMQILPKNVKSAKKYSDLYTSKKSETIFLFAFFLSALECPCGDDECTRSVSLLLGRFWEALVGFRDESHNKIKIRCSILASGPNKNERLWPK